MATELTLAKDALSLLQGHGDASLVYLTAEFEPFSSQGRPDICFVPERGPYAGEVFVTEFKVVSGEILLPHQIRSIVEHRSFVAESVDSAGYHFAFATSALLTPSVHSYLSSQNIRVMARIRDGGHLANEILLWSKSRGHYGA